MPRPAVASPTGMYAFLAVEPTLKRVDPWIVRTLLRLRKAAQYKDVIVVADLVMTTVATSLPVFDNPKQNQWRNSIYELCGEVCQEAWPFVASRAGNAFHQWWSARSKLHASSSRGFFRG